MNVRKENETGCWVAEKLFSVWQIMQVMQSIRFIWLIPIKRIKTRGEGHDCYFYARQHMGLTYDGFKTSPAQPRLTFFAQIFNFRLINLMHVKDFSGVLICFLNFKFLT